MKIVRIGFILFLVDVSFMCRCVVIYREWGVVNIVSDKYEI